MARPQPKRIRRAGKAPAAAPAPPARPAGGDGKARRKPLRLPADDPRYPGMQGNRMLHRALVILRAMEHGLPRGEAERLADEKVGPRSPPVPPRKAPGAQPTRRPQAATPGRGERAAPEPRRPPGAAGGPSRGRARPVQPPPASR